MSVLILVELRVKPESIDTMRAWLKDGLPDTRAAEGCEGVAVHANLDDRSNLVFVEHWNSKQQYEKYRAWRVERGDHARLVGMLSGNPSVRCFEIVGL
jgi:quinol monooxygenase YgiN